MNTNIKKCPECRYKMVKAGWSKTNRRGDRKQLWMCLKCRRRTLNPIEESK